jgi:hypothetical protein
MRPNTVPLVMPTDSPRGSVCMGHTHICSPRANDRFPPHKCAQRHAQREQEHSTQPGEAQQTTNTCTRERLQEPTIHRREPRRAHQHPGYHETNTRCSSALLTETGRLSCPHKIHQDRDPSRWRRCRRLAAARTMMDSMSAPASTASMNTSAE